MSDDSIKRDNWSSKITVLDKQELKKAKKQERKNE